MDKELIKERFAGAISTYDRAAVAQRHIAERLAELMAPYAPEGGTVFEAGCGTGIMSRLIMERLHPQRLYMVDLSESYRSLLALGREAALPILRTVATYDTLCNDIGAFQRADHHTYVRFGPRGADPSAANGGQRHRTSARGDRHSPADSRL